MALSDFLACKIGNDFGLSVEDCAKWIGSTTRFTSRFNKYFNDDYASCVKVLNIVKDCGMSPALFTAKECVEGYAMWGWHNHTVRHGDYYEDARYVANYTVTLDGSTLTPAWDDGGVGTYNVVPADVQAKGNAEYASWPNDCIGKKYCAMTAAATWGTWYPQALQASVNGVQNYGNAIQQVYDIIFGEMGGTLNGANVSDGITSGGGSANTEVTTTTTVSMEEVRKKVKEAIENVFNRNIQNLSPMYASNGKIAIKHIMNMVKADIEPDTLKEIIKIIEDVTVNSTTSSKGEAGDNAGTSAGDGNVTTGNSDKVNSALNAVAGILGQCVGTGQCYSLSAWYSVQISGYTCGAGVSGNYLTAIGDTYNACNLHTGWQWSQAGAQTIDYTGKDCPVSDIKAGDIFTIAPYMGAPVYTGVWGHTGIIKSVDANTIVVYEQNYAGHQYVEERSYSASAFASTIQGLVRWN